MDSRRRLDYALFQLTPTRTRCDLVICAGECKEKLASGLLEPFIAHLEFAKDQISKGGYSIKLSASGSATWFTKCTLERFVKFVNTPEVLERFITIEREIENIDCSINTGLSSDSQTVYGFEEHSNKSAVSSYKYIHHEGNTSDSVHEEDSKNRIHLQRVLETRKAMLQKEQAMVYARAMVAGFETDSLEDLICFADAFGSPRLREACLNFMELCNTKSNDRVWMDEVAAMQASSHSQYSSYLGTSGGNRIILPEENDDPSQELRINTQNGNFATKKQNGAVDLPHYIHSYQNGSMFQPPYQGYPFPPYYQGNLPWPQNVEHSRRSGKRSQTRSSRDGNFDLSDSSSGSDSGSYKRSSSRKKVVIRNINYITSEKDGEAEWVSNENSSKDKPEGEKVITQQWDTFQVLLMKDADEKVSEEVKKPHSFDENNDRLPEVPTKSSAIKGHEGDWFSGRMPDTQEHQSRDIFEDHFTPVKSTKDVLVDDPLAVVHGRSLNELSDSQLRRRDFLTAEESKLLTEKGRFSPKKKVEAECFNEPNDLYVVLERDTSGPQPMAVWTPEMELGNSKDKFVKLDSAEKGSAIEAKSKTSESKSGIISRSKKPTGTKTKILKSKSDKEEEKRKKMEELRIQRQKRIAERSASTAKTAAKNDKPKGEVASRGMKTSVIRSSTIDRLSAARVVNPKVLPTESKPGNKPTKVTTKENGNSKPAKKPTKVTTKENGETKPGKKPLKVTTMENSETKPGKKPLKVTTKEIGGSKPAKRPTKVTSSTPFSQRTVGAGKREVKPQKVEHVDKKNIGLKNSNKNVVLTNAKQFPRTSPIKKVGNGVARAPPNYQSAKSDIKKTSSVLQEDVSLSSGNNRSTNKVLKLNSVTFNISKDKEKPVVKVNEETVGKRSPERSSFRKKWGNIGSSTKALNGFRKLLSFAKRS